MQEENVFSDADKWQHHYVQEFCAHHYVHEFGHVVAHHYVHEFGHAQ